jgi:hypothetical protein
MATPIKAASPLLMAGNCAILHKKYTALAMTDPEKASRVI